MTEELCHEHQCPIVKVSTNRSARCLVEWLLDRCRGSRVVDFIPPVDDEIVGEIVFSTGLVLPVVRILRLASVNPPKPLWKHKSLDVRLDALSRFIYDGIHWMPRERKLYVQFVYKYGHDYPVMAEIDVDGALNELLGEEADAAVEDFLNGGLGPADGQ